MFQNSKNIKEIKKKEKTIIITLYACHVITFTITLSITSGIVMVTDIIHVPRGDRVGVLINTWHGVIKSVSYIANGPSIHVHDARNNIIYGLSEIVMTRHTNSPTMLTIISLIMSATCISFFLFASIQNEVWNTIGV